MRTFRCWCRRPTRIIWSCSRTQQQARGWRGTIVTNPNCSTIVLVMALAPLKPFGIKRVIVTTMQAISGAGYPGVASLDILGNVMPFIGGEEPKMESETQKILGTFAGDEDRAIGREGERLLQSRAGGGRAYDLRVGGV